MVCLIIYLIKCKFAHRETVKYTALRIILQQLIPLLSSHKLMISDFKLLIQITYVNGSFDIRKSVLALRRISVG